MKRLQQVACEVLREHDLDDASCCADLSQHRTRSAEGWNYERRYCTASVSMLKSERSSWQICWSLRSEGPRGLLGASRSATIQRLRTRTRDAIAGLSDCTVLRSFESRAKDGIVTCRYRFACVKGRRPCDIGRTQKGAFSQICSRISNGRSSSVVGCFSDDWAVRPVRARVATWAPSSQRPIRRRPAYLGAGKLTLRRRGHLGFFLTMVIDSRRQCRWRSARLGN